MVKLIAATLVALAAYFVSSLLFVSFPFHKPYFFYHSLFLSHPLSTAANATIAGDLQTLTSRPHLAGTPANSEVTDYVFSLFSSLNIPTHLSSYDALLSYPIFRSLTLHPPSPDKNPPISFNLKQDVYEGDPYADVSDLVVPTFHAYAKSGRAVGPALYVNYGRFEDFETLKQMGINVSGSVVLVRYGKIYRGEIVRNSYEAGAIGVVTFSDKKDYGGQDCSRGRWFPEGKWLPPTGVQVGTVYNGIGDPTTPGWSCVVGQVEKGECERISLEKVEETGRLPSIPSLPVSANDGEAILQWIGGEVAGNDWQGNADAPVYKIGPGPALLNLTYMGNETITRVQNVIGVIEGAEEPDRLVILGNHRDAWTFGAADPNSGTAALLEVARRLAELQKKGWRPRRTIALCNWDAEEFGLIGSAEWVEENRELLASRTVAYINVDTAVTGPGFHASATPQLEELLKQVSQQVPDPDNSSQSVYDSWVTSSNLSFGRLGGGGSDYASFVQHVGIPAADMYFGGGYPVYHSMYDNFVWMKEFGDPMFQRHIAVASIWGLVAFRLADEEFLPFDYLLYADELQKCVKELEKDVSGKGINLMPFYMSIEKLRKAASKINDQMKALEQTKSWRSMWKKDAWKVREINDRLMMAERAFTDRDGLPGKPWYKHLIYGPSKHNDYGSKSFAGIVDVLEKSKSIDTVESWDAVQHEVWRVSRAIIHASLVLNGQLT